MLPFGLENENRILAGVNALELTSQYTSYWRFKGVTDDPKKSAATVQLICIRQPDRHGKMGAGVGLSCLPCTATAAGRADRHVKLLPSFGQSCFRHFVLMRMIMIWPC